jgi:mono/diheme cytochrome c family protein
VGIVNRLGIGLALALIVGCQRAPELHFSSSKEVVDLNAELQQKLRQELEKYCGTPLHPRLLGDASISSQHLERGAAVYQDRCVHCHGVSGDGQGVAAEYMLPRPRDYRRGKFKFTSTPWGAKPRRQDLVRTVRHGAKGTSMPSFALLPENDLQAVVDYVLVLTHRGELEFKLAAQADDEDAIDAAAIPEMVAQIVESWQAAGGEVVLPVTKPIPYSDASAELGKKAFLTEEAGCFKCHGPDGRGLPVSAEAAQTFKDDWGFPARAADLTSGMFHGGNRPLDIYRRIYSGINGTPMPAFSQKFANEPEMFWHLVHYVEFVSGARRREVVEKQAKWFSQFMPAKEAPAP